MLGPNHLEVAHVLSNLGMLYDDLGRYAEARPIYERVVAIREATLGSSHPDVANILINLASLYHHQGRYAEAVPLYRRSLDIRRAELGPEHSDTSLALENLILACELLFALPDVVQEQRSITAPESMAMLCRLSP